MDHYINVILLFVCSKCSERYALYALHLRSQWRWKWVICVSGVHPVENNMPKINQEKICLPILRRLLLPLSGLRTNGVILYRKCNYSCYWKRPCHYNHEWFVFFLQPFSQVIGEVSSKWIGRNRNSSPDYTSHFNDPAMMQATLDVIINPKWHWFGHRSELRFSKIRFWKLFVVILRVRLSWRNKPWWHESHVLCLLYLLSPFW